MPFLKNDIASASKIAGVMTRGKWLARAEMDTGLKKIEEKYLGVRRPWPPLWHAPRHAPRAPTAAATAAALL